MMKKNLLSLLFLALPLFYIIPSENIALHENVSHLLEQAKDVVYSNPEQALGYASRIVQILPSDDKSNEKIEAMLLYGLAERFLGNFDSGIKILFDALEYLEDPYSSLAGEVYLLIGLMYNKLSDYNKAIEYNDRATAIFKTVNDSILLADSYKNRGLVHYNLDEFNIAEQFFQQSLSINRSLKQMKEIAANLNNLCLYKGDFEEKYNYITEAIIINKNLDARWALGENYNNLAKQYYFNRNYNSALEALSTASDIAHNIGAKELISDNFEYHSLVYKAMGNYEKAYQALEQLHLLNNELQSSNKLRSVELEISNKRLSEQRILNEKNVQNYKIEILKRNLFLLLALLVVILLVAVFLNKWHRRKKEMELVNAQFELEQTQREVTELKIKQQDITLTSYREILEVKKQEITELAVFSQSQNELLDNIRAKIKKGYNLSAKDMKDHLKSINLFIIQYQNSNSINNKLLNDIEQYNSEFKRRLLQKHENLTKGEVELASLLLIDLSTKEIAIITGRSPKTVNMSRYRLRKSMNLSTDQNLNKYLQSI